MRDLSESRRELGVFGRVPELVASIERCVDQHRRDPKPFIGTAMATGILMKVSRAKAKLDKMQSD